MPDTTMKDIINNIKTALDNAVTAGTLSAKSVVKGFSQMPEQVTDDKYPYIMIDEGGESTEIDNPGSTRAQNRIFYIILEMGVWRSDVAQSLDDILALTNQVKSILESGSNKFADGMRWGIEITPFGWEADTKFFRGRSIRLAYTQLEDIDQDDY